MFHFVNCISSLVPVAESSADSFSAMCASAPLSWRNTLGLSSSSASETGSCLGSPCGMMSAPSMEPLGAGGLMSLREDSHAPTSRQSGKVLEFKASTRASGEKWPESLVRFDPNTSLWRTHQISLLGDSEPFSGTCPAWGSMRNGECWAHITPWDLISGIGSGFVQLRCQTPKAVQSSPTELYGRGRTLSPMDQAKALGGTLNPDYSEWVMGWPIRWTALKPLAWAKFQSWLASHGEPSCGER